MTKGNSTNLGAADNAFSTLRSYINDTPLVMLTRAARALLHFGPWRSLPRRLIPTLKIARPRRENGQPSLLGSLDANSVADEIRRNSFALVGVLPADFVARLREITDRLPVDHYELMHELDENVRLLVEDSGINAVLAAYMGCEPVLLESTLGVIRALPPNAESEAQNMFHFDYAGWQSLNVFVYLTDVTADSSHHVVIKGSHRHVKFGDAIRTHLPDDEALRRFPEAIETVLGPAGTVFIENTEAFHKRHRGTGRRVMLNLLYASHRNLLSHGRSTNERLAKRADVYAAARAAAGLPPPH